MLILVVAAVVAEAAMGQEKRPVRVKYRVKVSGDRRVVQPVQVNKVEKVHRYYPAGVKLLPSMAQRRSGGAVEEPEVEEEEEVVVVAAAGQEGVGEQQREEGEQEAREGYYGDDDIADNEVKDMPYQVVESIVKGAESYDKAVRSMILGDYAATINNVVTKIQRAARFNEV